MSPQSSNSPASNSGLRLKTVIAVALIYPHIALAAPKVPPTIHVAGDSTAAYWPPTDPRQGWAAELDDYVSVPVNNMALSGRSTRSFIYEGVWDELIALTKKNDFVIIEFGHNDDKPDDRATLLGTGKETELRYNTITQKNETVLTYGGYLRKMIKDVEKKGAYPILSSMTPRYNWQGPQNLTMLTVYPFAGWTKEVAVQQEVAYFDHLNYTIKFFEEIGYEAGFSLFAPNDRTHTNPAGAVELAKTLINSAKCTGKKVHSTTKKFLSDLSADGKAVEKDCY